MKDLIKRGIDVYLTLGTAKALNLDDDHRLHIVEALKTFVVGEWRVLPFETQHDANEPVGFLLSNGTEKILFATDTFYIKYRFTGITHALIECNYSAEILAANVAVGLIHPSMEKRLLKSHFSLSNVVEFLKASDLSQLKEIHLIHLSDNNSDEILFKKTIQALIGVPVYAD